MNDTSKVVDTNHYRVTAYNAIETFLKLAKPHKKKTELLRETCIGLRLRIDC